jgi:hypothetical protein
MVVTVKAYPAIGRTTGEAVCVAGVRIDSEFPTWVRLFPVPFRDLDKLAQFKKWQVIRVRAKRGSKDRRTESYQPDLSTIQLGEVIDTQSNGWNDRWMLVEPLIDQFSACELFSAARRLGQAAPSLGLITPQKIESLTVTSNPEYETYHNKTMFEQGSLLGQPRKELEPPPFKAVYRYRCSAPECKGHNQTLVDWESGQLARKLILNHGVVDAKKKHHEKFYEDICGPGIDTKFFIGNQYSHPNSFLVIGVFYPKKGSQPMPTLGF